MRNRSFLFISVCLVFILFSASLAFATNAWVPDRTGKNVPGELIIGFSAKATLAQINSAVLSVGGRITGNLTTSKGRTTRIKILSADPSAAETAMAQLKSNAALKTLIRYVEPNVVRRAFAVRRPGGDFSISSQGGDQILGEQWGYYDIQANLINAPTTTTGVMVAVVDTGVDYNHPELTGKVTKGKDYVNADKDPMDDMGHGTHVAGIIAAKANNNYGIIGVSPNSKILAIKVLDSAGYGNSFDVALGIRDAANNSSVKVINLSLGGTYAPEEDEAVDYAVNAKGKLVVASAGNDNTNDTTSAYPAALSIKYPGRVLAVAAHDTKRCQASVAEVPSDPFSNYGTWVSISAPGYDVLSTVPISTSTPWSQDGYYYLSGTSMAAPHVTGAAALAWQKNATFTNTQIANLITTQNASVVRDGTCWPNGPDDGTFGRLTVLHMLEKQYYEDCDNKGLVYGYALDAETGLPLAGAKVTLQNGKIINGADYVPFFGEATSDTGLGLTGSGLFNVLTAVGDNTLTIQKSKYMTFASKDEAGLAETVPVIACQSTYAGSIPVPPAKPLYWLAVTWDVGYTDAYYDLWVSVYQNGEDVSPNWPGTPNQFPYVKYSWDSDNPNLNPSDLRRYSESIRVAKLIPGGDYLFFVEDFIYDGLQRIPNIGSVNWASSGIKAYLYKGKTLLKTYTPPGGAGAFWVIADVFGNTIQDINEIQDPQ